MALVAVASFVCLFEFSRMIVPHDRLAQLVVLLSGLFLFFTQSGTLEVGLPDVLQVSLITIGLTIFFLFRAPDAEAQIRSLSFSTLGVLWTGVLPASAVLLRRQENGDIWFFLATFASWGE